MSDDLNVSDDTRIAPGFSVGDWKVARARILGPIEKILANDAARGEGFAAMALSYMLIEFVQSIDWLQRFRFSI
jgi:hypothetical protein